MRRGIEAIVGGILPAIGLNSLVLAATLGTHTKWLTVDLGASRVLFGPALDGALLLYPTFALVIFYRDQVLFWRTFGLLALGCFAVLVFGFGLAFGPVVVLIYGLPTSLLSLSMAFEDEMALSIAFLAYSALLNSAILAGIRLSYRRRRQRQADLSPPPR